MRKLFFAVGIAFLVAACGELGLYDTKIVNNSSYDITFKMSQSTVNASTHTVKAGETITVENPKGSTIDEYSNFQRVEYNDKRSWEGVFTNRQELTLKINNTFSFPVSISAGGFMGVDPIVVNDIAENTIFTRTPNFNVSAGGFPAVVEYNIVDNTMYVTVR